MNTNPYAWRKTPITREQWEANCYASSHRRDGETLSYNDNNGVVSCWVNCSNGNTSFIGAFWVKGDAPETLPSTGWNYE